MANSAIEAVVILINDIQVIDEDPSRFCIRKILSQRAKVATGGYRTGKYNSARDADITV